ncbi:Na+/H+ antiporter subunit G [Guyparkeria hydrothermalis]|uniref:Na+/H+ antiporter subunit G n=1 Tax=Guyparkeria hydrothermalis TaxID=923 RepID=UPI002021C343|nr:Na+/H+ antiporter subunit G [Guyparkeria hydrothermalis]MCL7744194.1 Na+/H+ antiporter subunit G [Guyparkeria hydrothermalis]
MIFELIVSGLILFGAAFVLLGSLGLAKLPSFFMRLHGPTKASTLGVGSILLASAVYFSSRGGLSVHEILILIFLFITAPVSALLMARAGMHRDLGGENPAHEETHKD